MKKKKELAPRCQRLNSDLKQCRARTWFQIEFSGNPELQDYHQNPILGIRTVKVYVCPGHCIGTIYANQLLK